MGEIQNLKGEAAIDKLRFIAEGNICMLCAYTGAEKMYCRPMYTAHVDDDGNMWFLSRNDAVQDQKLQHKHKVALMYTDSSKQAYLVVNGEAIAINADGAIDELWNPALLEWFPEGRTDPSIELIMVAPSSGHYWDTSRGKLLAMLHIISSAITGTEEENSRQGSLEL